VCGVAAIVLREPNKKITPELIMDVTIAITNRGQDAHGVSGIRHGKVVRRTRLGWIGTSEANSEIFSKIRSPTIFHARYVTSSENTEDNAQPIKFKIPGGGLASIAHNGNLTNVHELLKKEQGKEDGKRSDTWALGKLLAPCLREEDCIGSLGETLGKVKGSYSFTILVGGKDPRVIAARDPHGYMPLLYGENEKGRYVASESVAFDRNCLDVPCFREVQPGEMLVIRSTGVASYQVLKPKELAFCALQIPYMCRPESKFGEYTVLEMRKRLGAEIAKHYRPDVDIVVGIPDSGVAAAMGYAEATGLPSEMGIVRCRYRTARSFMKGSQSERATTVNKKLNPVPNVLRGKSVLLVDDSVIRGTTIEDQIAEVKIAGAREVHVASTFPPVISGCRFGVDFDDKELIARRIVDDAKEKGEEMTHEKMNLEMARRINAKSAYYLTLDSLANAFGMPRNSLCPSCVTGKYYDE
jgi:amidophosphoribosyltransferase